MKNAVFMTPLLAGSILAGCGTPYGDKLSIDYGPAPISGSIAVSDAKLYRREALINERRREQRYIDGLLAATEKEGFVIGPEITREIEVIQSLALSLGLSFDPAAGATFRDQSAKASIQQQIDTLGLQLQLEQLQRNAEIFRTRIASEAVVSNADTGKLTAPGAAVAAPALTAADTAELVSRIDALQSALATRLGTAVPEPRAVKLAGNPIDQFRDRAAYRQILTTARNAASLDELHDQDGAALYRLTFQVTTLPPKSSHGRTAGMVEMVPIAGGPDESEMEDIYLRWLYYIADLGRKNAKPGSTRPGVDEFLIASKVAPPIQFVFGPVPPGCLNAHTGFEQVPTTTPIPRCQRPTRTLIAPDFAGSSISFESDNRTMGDVVSDDIPRLLDSYNKGLVLVRNPAIRAALLVPGKCELNAVNFRRSIPRVNADGTENTTGQADTIASRAILTLTAVPYLSQLLTGIAASGADDVLRAAIDIEQQHLDDAEQRAAVLLGVLGEGPCAGGKQLFVPQPIAVPKRFDTVVRGVNNVRVYEVGPREQVQQVSTAARAAQAFSLAVAVAAKAPSSGVAANAGLGYARNAIGKADVIERLPVVVGYAQAGLPSTQAGVGGRQPAFGWILGPRVNTVDPAKGKLELAQGLKVYDLSADLSVSGWRTRLPMKVTSEWSPDWRSKAFNGTIGGGTTSYEISVPLAPSAAEFAFLTQQLGLSVSGRGQRPAVITDLRPKKIKACAAATLILQGEGIWRATDVIIGGKRIGADNLAVLPDMRGITVEIPADTSFPDSDGTKVEVEALTPYGAARGEEKLLIDGYSAADGCKPVAKTEGPAVSKVSPDAVNICSSPGFDLSGKDLDKITRVKIGGANGVLAAATSGNKQRRVTFKEVDLQSVAGEFDSMQFFNAEGVEIPKAMTIRFTNRNCATAKD